MTHSPSILLIIGGGIAAYKSLELIRLLRGRDIGTRCILTPGGAQFVTPLSVAALSGSTVHSNLFDLTDEVEMGHIQLSRSADLIVVCPASADLMARAAHGMASDLAATALLATDTPVLMVPAMNVRMWHHEATRRNVERLRADGIHVMEPEEGAMACNEFGVGRLPEPEDICRRIVSELSGKGDTLAGRRAVVTAGPTRESIDPVRYLSSESSGRQGYALAASLRASGAAVTLVSGPVALEPPRGVRVIQVRTAREMYAAVEEALPTDIFIGVAAVADWRPAIFSPDKLKLKNGAEPPRLTLEENPDILRAVAARSDRPKLVIGFAAETCDVDKHARSKLLAKGCDWIVANDVSKDVMGGAYNEVSLIREDGLEHLPRMSKTKTADALTERIGALFTGVSQQNGRSPLL